NAGEGELQACDESFPRFQSFQKAFLGLIICTIFRIWPATHFVEPMPQLAVPPAICKPGLAIWHCDCVFNTD
ncbi:MAG: hypothetical protein AAF394_09400, partial [Planctomycetota bacterium]